MDKKKTLLDYVYLYWRNPHLSGNLATLITQEGNPREAHEESERKSVFKELWT